MNTDRTTILSLALTLLLVASAVPAGVVELVGTASADEHGDWYTLRQPGTDVCYEVQAFTNDHEKMRPEVVVRGGTGEAGSYKADDWDGPVTIESIMDYRYYWDPDGPNNSDGGSNLAPVGQTDYYAPYLAEYYRNEGWLYGTFGLYNWSTNGESHMFFYENADGDVSLVVRHDKLYDGIGTESHGPYNGKWPGYTGIQSPQPGGGSATWEFENLPQGEWAYIDDMYVRADMDDVYTDGDGTRYGHREAEYESQPLESYDPEDDGRSFRIEWIWGSNGTDGGAYRGLDNLDGELRIDPSFSNVDAWRVRHNNGSAGVNGEQFQLDMDAPLVVERGRNCLDAAVSADRDAVEAGESVTFTAESGAEEYRWDVDADGRPEQNTSVRTYTHTYNESGTKQVRVTIDDGDRTVEASTAVEVRPGEPPTADFAVDDDAGDADSHVVGERITLNASPSTDNVALSGDYEWDVNGTSETGRLVTTRFDAAGTHEVTLTVTDRSGKSGSVTKTIEVVAQDDPEASASGSPSEVEAGATVSLDGSESSDDRGRVVRYEWNAPNGDVSDANESNPGANVTFGSAGEYRVDLTVEDNNGNTDTDSVNVSVTRSIAPNVTDVSVPNQVSAGEQFDVSATFEDDGRKDSVTYRFSDGANETVAPGESVTHAFDSAGTSEVWVVVRDAAGNRNESRRYAVDVTNAPTADLSVGPDEPGVGDQVTFDASGSGDADGSITAYRWDFDGDGTVERTTNASRSEVTYRYESADTYAAAVTVVDDSNLTDAATVQVDVQAEEAKQDESDSGTRGGGVGGGGGGSLGPPPVQTETEQSGANAATIDVRNARADETVNAELPESAVAERTGVSFRSLAIDVRRDDPHVVFETAASADPPADVAAPTGAGEALTYLGVDSQYLDGGVGSLTVEFSVNRSALGGLATADDVRVYRYDGAWQRVNATVVDRTDDGYRLKATTDGLGTLAVGANAPLAVTDAGLADESVATGDTLSASATVENAGTTARSATVNLTLDGSAVASKTVEVPAGESVEVTLNATAPAPGTYEATLAGTSLGDLTVENATPADVSVAEVSLNRTTIAAGEQVAITAVVENTGDKAGEETVALTMFGERIATRNVSVDGESTTEVTFVRQVDAAGNYTVKVDGQSARLGVTEPDGDDDLGDAAPNVPGFGVGTALVALLAAALLARLRG